MKIPEIWAFDSMYQSAGSWAAWSKANPASKYFTYYTKIRFKNGTWHSTYLNSVELERMKLPNVHVERAGVGHNQVPGKFWRTRANAAAFFQNV